MSKAKKMTLKLNDHPLGLVMNEEPNDYRDAQMWRMGRAHGLISDDVAQKISFAFGNRPEDYDRKAAAKHVKEVAAFNRRVCEGGVPVHSTCHGCGKYRRITLVSRAGFWCADCEESSQGDSGG